METSNKENIMGIMEEKALTAISLGAPISSLMVEISFVISEVCMCLISILFMKKVSNDEMAKMKALDRNKRFANY